MKLLNTEDENLISAKVEFLNPETKESVSLDLKNDGFYIHDITSSKTEEFNILANLMTKHYYDDQNHNKDTQYTLFGALLPINENEFEIVTEDSL